MKQLTIESTEFCDRLIGWFQAHGRQLPWRQTTDPYRILVSELMLQQTQVAAVLSYYERWLQRFPDLPALAAAQLSDVLHAWQGLGYYRRARNLHACAGVLVQKYGGRFPETVSELVLLPGVGRYTAGAIASFAFDRPAAIVDANVARVLSRLENYSGEIDTAAGQAFLWSVADRLVRRGRPRLLNSALMELGATVCIPQRPRCERCPVRPACRAVVPHELPRKKPRPQITERTEDYAWMARDGQVLLQQRSGRVWHGLWTLPALTPKRSERAVLVLRHPITRFIVRLRVFLAASPAALEPGSAWQEIDRLPQVAMPTPHRRAVQAMLEGAARRPLLFDLDEESGFV